MRALLITYYWYPSGGVVVRRAFALAKYLPQNGIETDVLTIDSKYPWINIDKDTKAPDVKVYSTPNKHLSNLFNPDSSSVISKLWCGVNAIFNMDYMSTWVKSSKAKLEEILEKNEYDFVIITIPPFSLLSFIPLIKQKAPKSKIILDMRDSFYSFRNDNILQKFRRAFSMKKSRRLISKADYVISVSPGFLENIRELNSNVKVFTNGYDFELDNAKKPRDGKVSFGHTGSFPNTGQTPIYFIDGYILACSLSPEFKDNSSLEFVGITKNELERLYGKLLPDNLNIITHGKMSHRDAIEKMRNFDINTVVLTIPPEIGGSEVIPYKLFECIGINKPILVTTQENSSLWQIVENDNLGYLSSNKPENIAKNMHLIYNDVNGNNISPISEEIQKKFRFENIMSEYSSYLKEIKKHP